MYSGRKLPLQFEQKNDLKNIFENVKNAFRKCPNDV